MFNAVSKYNVGGSTWGVNVQCGVDVQRGESMCAWCRCTTWGVNAQCGVDVQLGVDVQRGVDV
jgi:hypothetical protein